MRGNQQPVQRRTGFVEIVWKIINSIEFREVKERKLLRYTMRSLHRDISFFLIGLTIIYTISGILLIYRDSDFLKHEVNTEREIKPNLSESDLGMALHARDFKVLKTEGDLVYLSGSSSEIQ
jgi:hypothetical protein